MATSLYKGQIPLRTKGQTTCLHHKGGELDFYCKSCEELACKACLSTVHNSHSLYALSEITSQQKRDIQNFIEKTEKDDLVQVDQYIISTDKLLKDNSTSFKKMSQQLKTQTNKLKYDLDLLTAKTLSLYQQMEDDNAKLLQTYKQDLEMYSTHLKQQVQECTKVLQRGSDVQIYDTGRDIQSPVQLPVKPTLGTASFTPNRNPQNRLEQALGEVNTSGQGQPFQGNGQSVGSSIEQRLPYAQQNKEIENVTGQVYTLLTDTEMLEKWKSPCYITSVCPTTDGKVWTCVYDYDVGRSWLTLLDRKGKVIQEAKHDSEISDISLSPSTNTLWVCDDQNNITELVSGELVHRFSTDDSVCICITASNHVIVGKDQKISKFTTKGKQVLTTMVTGTGKPLVCTPHMISECPVTHNVAVADMDQTLSGGDGKPRIIVMDTDFKKLFVYNGEVPSTRYSFHPSNVVYDSVGDLVIGDNNNDRILLFSGGGEFLKIILTDDYGTHYFGVDREDVLWAVFWGPEVRLLKYSHVGLLDK